MPDGTRIFTPGGLESGAHALVIGGGSKAVGSQPVPKPPTILLLIAAIGFMKAA
ncbi:MAG: hypothetical protein JXB10_11810 [Pirellulales bacterium]|nr:hypothetical protein [Pirellulales bacterium]